MKRMLCVWFPLWPIQRIRGQRPELGETPLILYAPSRGKMTVQVCSPWAAKHGVKPGMPLGEAQAILGTASAVHLERWDPGADAAALHQAAAWCQRFSPLVATEEPDSLLLNITGCSHLFGGELQMAEQAVAQLRTRGYIARAAIAGTPSAAWAVAHYHAATVHVVLPGQLADALHPLPIAALRLATAVIQTLRELDVHRIGQLVQLPLQLLPSRFGPEILYRLDQALGEIGDPLTPEKVVEPDEVSWTFEPPCSDRRVMEWVLEHLLGKLLERLHPRQQGIQRLECHFFRDPTDFRRLSVGLLQPSASLLYVMDLLRLHQERADWGGEITAVTLRAVAAPLTVHQGRIFDSDPWSERLRQFPVLLEVLSNRLGKQAVLRPYLQADAQPECAWRYEPWLEQDLAAAAKAAAGPPNRQAFYRPPRLRGAPVAVKGFSMWPQGPPARFEWGRRSWVVACWWGPERIETGWWRGADIRRDYYLVETTTAERFWLFRVMDQEQWFLHGTFA